MATTSLEALSDLDRRHVFHPFSVLGQHETSGPRRLIAYAPPGMSKVLYGNSGSDANDTQVKLVRMYNNLLGRPRKKKIISRWRGYHGVSLASASLTGLSGMHTAFDLPLGDIRHVRAP